MADESGASVKSRVCPYLGLERDRSSHRVVPMEAHRCYAGQTAFEVDFERQSYYCLSGRYELCPRRVLGAPEEADVAGTAAEVEAAEPQTPIPARSGRAAVPRTVAVAGVLVLVALIVLAGSWVVAGGFGAPASQPPVAAPALPLPSGTAPGTSEPISSLQPVSSQSAAPLVATPSNPPGNILAGGSSAMPTPTVPPPAPSPTVRSAARTYLVPYGDTLGQISTRFGVPVEEIMKANNIPNQDVILAGRTIVIP